MLSELRNGRFTSSEIVALTKKGKGEEFGKPYYTYIKRKNQERKLGRSMSVDGGGKAAIWGKFVENWLMYKRPDILGLEYTLTPETTLQHPNYPDYWAGSRDGFNNATKAVIDLKCPWTLESFCDFADCESIEQVRAEHQSGETYYWQLVSNACIAGVDRAELIVFMPNPEHLAQIGVYAINGSHGMEGDVYFIGNGDMTELPYLPANSGYKSLVKFCFEIPQSDKDFLTSRVESAIKLIK